MDAHDYDFDGARRRIDGHVLRTPLLASPSLTDLNGTDTRLKLECLQVTGSFKARGAANKILSLGAEERERGVIAISSGNHGLATAWVASTRSIAATVCVPEWVDPAKLEAMQRAGAEVVVHGATSEEAEDRSLELQRERGLTYVHPFDDPLVIAGQGTIALEVLEQAPDVRTLIVPVSGGGLIGGIAAAIARRAPQVRVVGVFAEAAPVMARSVEAGRLVELPEEPTIATALAGNLGPQNLHTLDLVSTLVHELVGVSEEEILDAMRFAYREHRLIVEGGGAVGLAAMARWPGRWEGPVAVVVSGGNIDLGRFRDIVTGQ